MEKFKRISTHHFLTRRMTDTEDKSVPVNYRIFTKSALGDFEIPHGGIKIVSRMVELGHNGKTVGKEDHFFLEVDHVGQQCATVIYSTDLGSVKNGLPDDNRIIKLVEMGCEILNEWIQEEHIPNFNHADFLKRMGFPFSIAVHVDEDGKEDENGMYCLINGSYDVICESPVLAQVQAIRDALNFHTTAEVF